MNKSSLASRLISVVVCTYNRADLLAVCLTSLAGQTLDKCLYEVIIVNNNSTDDTQVIAESVAGKYDNFRVVVEKNQGLSQARNRGWREAQGSYVAYIDDDAVALSDWLMEICSFLERHPDVKAFGGPYSAICDMALPAWLPEGYGSWSLGDIERMVTSVGELPNGTNMIFHFDLLSEIGGFDSLLGMRGGVIGYGEDTKFLNEIVAHNIPIFYAPKVKVLHRVLLNKLTVCWFLKSYFQAGKDSEIALGCSRSLISHLLCVVVSIVKGGRTLLSGNFVEALAPIMLETGGLLEHLFRVKGQK